MIGLKRLANVRMSVEDVLANEIPGDLIETGAWRGGTTIFMRAILKVHGVTDRLVWVADSFAELPPPDPSRYPADHGDRLYTFPQLAVNLDRVRDNFRRYDLLDEKVRLLKGWFCGSLPAASIERLAVLRLDGDLYESTIQSLESLYDRLSSGGYVIVDDYGRIAACRQAMHDFRAVCGITDPTQPIDWAAPFFLVPSTGPAGLKRITGPCVSCDERNVVWFKPLMNHIILRGTRVDEKQDGSS